MKGGWMKVVGALVAVLLLASFATPVVAQPGDPEPPKQPDLVSAFLWIGYPVDFSIVATVPHPKFPGQTTQFYAWCPNAYQCELEYDVIYDAEVWTSHGTYPNYVSVEGFTVEYRPGGVIYLHNSYAGQYRAWASLGYDTSLPPGAY